MATDQKLAPGRVRPRPQTLSTRRRTSSPWDTLLPLCLFLGALILRLWGINNESLWLDEGYTLLFSRLPLKELILVGGAHEHPPLYYLIVHLGLLINDSYLVPRIISAVAGSLSVWPIYALGTRLFNRPAGFVAGLLLLVSPFHLWYSQDGRAYELAGLFVLLSYLAVFTALDHSRTRTWVWYVLATALALYTEYTVVLAILPQVLLLVRARQRHLAAPLLRSWVAGALLFLPWIGTVILDAKSIAGTYWIPPPNAAALTNTALQFLGVRGPCPSPPCTGPEPVIFASWGHEQTLALVALLVVVAILAWALARRNLPIIILVTWLLAPFVLVLVIAVWWSLYLDRVFLDVSFALFLLIAAGLSRRAPLRWALAAAVAVAMMASSLATAHQMAARPSNPDWRTATHDLGSAYRPGQAVAFVPGVLRQIVGAYLPPGWKATRELTLWYHAYLDVPGWQKRYWSLTDEQLRDRQMTALARGERQVWLLSQDYVGLNDTRRWLEVHGFHPAVSEIYPGDTRLELWDRNPPARFGSPVLVSHQFSGWRRSGLTHLSGPTAEERGRASLSRTFSLSAGRAYTVSVHYLGIPPANPSVQIQTYNRQGRVVGTMQDRFGRLLSTFPRTEWYDLPAVGAWVSDPFGFVAPPGAVRATITLSNSWGVSRWRDIAVYQSR